MERTLVVIKPDGVQRNLVGEIIGRLEKKALKLVAAKFITMTYDQASKHYQVHNKKPFFAGLVAFITSSPVMVMVWEGDRAIEAVRQVIGATNPANADMGTIRADFALNITENIIHASEDKMSADYEIALYFKPEDIQGYTKTVDRWVKSGGGGPTANDLRPQADPNPPLAGPPTRERVPV